MIFFTRFAPLLFAGIFDRWHLHFTSLLSHAL
jgi:hypothetical protein